MVIFYGNSYHKRTVAIFLAAVLVFCTLPYFPQMQSTPVAGNTTGDWGLSFQTPGKTPVTNVTREYLLPYDAYFVGDENEKVIYLTFDAGYENGNMPKLYRPPQGKFSETNLRHADDFM